MARANDRVYPSFYFAYLLLPVLECLLLFGWTLALSKFLCIFSVSYLKTATCWCIPSYSFPYCISCTALLYTFALFLESPSFCSQLSKLQFHISLSYLPPKLTLDTLLFNKLHLQTHNKDIQPSWHFQWESSLTHEVQIRLLITNNVTTVQLLESTPEFLGWLLRLLELISDGESVDNKPRKFSNYLITGTI